MKYPLIALPMLSGLLLTLAFPPLDLWPLAFLAIVPLLALAYNPEISNKKLFLAGFLAGFVFFALILRYLLAAHPLTWLGIESDILSLSLITGTYILIVSVYSLFLGLFTLFLGQFKKSSNLLLPASLWVLFEYLRAWAFSLFWAGPGALLGPHWTIGDLGYSLHTVPLLRSPASVGGVYMLSFLVVLANTVFFRRLKLSVILGGLLCWVLVGLFLYQGSLATGNNALVRVALVTTNIPAGLSSSLKALGRQDAGTLGKLKEGFASGADIIIFPEGAELSSALLGRYVTADNVADFFQKETGTHPRVLVDNMLAKNITSAHPHSRLVYLDTKDGLRTFYDKRLLFPVGEYMPYIFNIALKISGQGKLAQEFESLRALDPGRIKDVVAATRFGKVGGLVCSGIISPNLVKDMTRNGAELIVVVSSDSIFRGHPVLLAQNEAMSQIRAVESGRPFVQATNGGQSYAIDPQGNVVARFNSSDPIASVPLTLQDNQTIYVRLGDWILLISLLIVAQSTSERLSARRPAKS